ncbi:MAG: hypothetical protein QM504_14200 [Pseudomonadota bacterium]
MKKIVLIILCVVAFNAYTVTPTMTYQGVVTNNGVVVNANVNVTVSFLNQAIGGSVFWQENFTNINVNNGVFTVVLGNTDPLDANLFADDVWVDLVIDGDQ